MSRMGRGRPAFGMSATAKSLVPSLTGMLSSRRSYSVACCALASVPTKPKAVDNTAENTRVGVRTRAPQANGAGAPTKCVQPLIRAACRKTSTGGSYLVADIRSTGGKDGSMDLLEQLTAALGDRYRVERELGHGGMAVVFLAEDLKHRRRVAIKLLKPDLSAVVGSERFLREIEIAASLQHPHIL